MPGGRPRKTDEQKKREGTFRKDRATPEAAQFSAISKIPNPPDFFDDVGKNVWNTICGELINIGIMQSIDIYQIEMICNELSIYWKCINEMNGNMIISTGTGSEKVNPLYTAANAALNNFNKMCKDYGFTPTARMKLRINAESKKKINPALELINRKKLIS